MNYKNAFRCKKCPESQSADGCPVWMEVAMTNDATGEVKIDKKCGFQFMPYLLVEVIKAANRPAEEISAMRGEHLQMMSAVGEKMVEAIQLKLVPTMGEAPGQERIHKEIAGQASS